MSALPTAIARDHCLAPGRGVDADGGRYGCLFADLPALESDETRLLALGVCDGAALQAAGSDDASVAAGWRFFGQFVAHDMTADRSPAARHADPEAAQPPHAAREPRVRLRRRPDERVLTAEQVGLAEQGWQEQTPLWFYLLREADALREGDALGPVGGRIVDGVLAGIVEADAESVLSVDPSWSPTLPAATPGRYTLLDLLSATELAATEGA